jgi:two-component system, cell cycle sensor histidine kinase and response regulator CckA
MVERVSQKSLRVLIVEDSVDDVDLILRELQRSGYQVDHERVDTREGLLNSIERRHWDLIICDYSMPHFSGADALKLIRERKIDTPFIYLSGTLGEETAIDALKQGAQDYLMKGNLRRLVPAIERELREAQQSRERALLEKQVQQLERFEAIGRLAGGVAHDFTNVISSIFGWAQLGEEEAPAGSRLRERFQRIEAEAKRAADITQKLLAFGRKQVLQPITLNLNRAILEIRDFLAPGLGSAIQLRLVLAPDLQTIRADPTQIGQVIMNLCLNAKDAIEKSGTVVIETRNVLVDSTDRLSDCAVRAGRYVLLSVSDNGVGMDAGTQERIFEPFFTTKEIGKGTGLGLSTVYGIVRQHDGLINVHSEIGKGATFEIYFPSLPGVPEDRPAPAQEKPVQGTETILLVDDEDSLREVSQEVLTRLGYKVLTAENGEQATRMFGDHAAEIQLVLLDLVMPGMGGLEALLAIKKLKPVPVILMTGHLTEALSANSIPRDLPLLQKPYSPKTLAQIVRNTLDLKFI